MLHVRSDIAQEMQVALILNHIPEYKLVISFKFLGIIITFLFYFINVALLLSKQLLIYLVFERKERKKKKIDSYIFKINLFYLILIIKLLYRNFSISSDFKSNLINFTLKLLYVQVHYIYV